MMGKVSWEKLKVGTSEYYLEKGLRDVFVDLWDNGFKHPGKIQRFYKGFESSHIGGRQSQLVWLFLRKNKIYVKEFSEGISEPASWLMTKPVNPQKILIASDYQEYFPNIFFRQKLQLLDQKNKAQVDIFHKLIDSNDFNLNFRMLLVPAGVSDTDALKMLKSKPLSSRHKFQKLKGSAKDHVLTAALSKYIFDCPDNTDPYTAFRLAEADIFERSKLDGVKSKSKIEGHLKSSISLINSAPFNFLFSAG